MATIRRSKRLTQCAGWGECNSREYAAWDPIVLSQAKYDFVEFHFYAQTPGEENDTSLVQQGAQQFTQNIDAVKADLKTAGAPDTPIYVGEIRLGL